MAGVLRLALASFALCLAASAAAAQTPGRRVAFIVGNDAYTKLRPLANPRADASRLARLLDRNGFDVLSCNGKEPGCFNLTREGMTEALDDLKVHAKGADLVLFFYAGHGLQVAEGNVIAPTDMEIGCGAEGARRGIVLGAVLEAMKDAKQKIVVMDACRNDPLPQCPGRGALALSFGSFALPDAESLLLVASTKPGQLAQDGPPGAHSPFARALFEWLEKAPATPFDTLFDRVAATVIEETTRANFAQVPERLVRGVAPAHCLKAGGCGADPEAQTLRARVAVLETERSFEQQIVRTWAEQLGIQTSTRGLSDEDKQKLVTALAEVGRLLGTRGEAGKAAQVALARGETASATALLNDELAMSEQTPRTTDAQRKEAAANARRLAALARTSDIAKAAEFYKRAAGLDPEDGQNWDDYARTARDAGRSSEAKAAFEQAIATAREAKTNTVQFFALLGLGDVVRTQGDLAGAQRHLEAAVALATAQVKENPRSTAWQRNFGLSKNTVGDILKDQRRFDEALAAYRESATTSERLIALDPKSLTRQRDLAVAHNRIGEVLEIQKRRDEAIAAYRASLEIRQRLAKAEPSNAGRQVDLTVAQINIADVYRDQGKFEEALAWYGEAREIREKLAAADPQNKNRHHLLATVHFRLGKTLRTQGKRQDGLASVRFARDLREPLARSDPDNAFWQIDLAWTYWELAAAGDEPLQNWQHAVDVLRAMQLKGTLIPSDAKWLPVAEERLKRAIRDAGARQSSG
jgi:tetratricopeptide (TPR) repeat protein